MEAKSLVVAVLTFRAYWLNALNFASAVAVKKVRLTGSSCLHLSVEPVTTRVSGTVHRRSMTELQESRQLRKFSWFGPRSRMASTGWLEQQLAHAHLCGPARRD